MAHEVSSVGFGLVHPSPMDLEASQSPEVSAQCGPCSCPSHPSLLPPWQVRMGLPGTSWMGMARFVAFSVEQEAFPSLSLPLPKCCTPNSQHCWPGEVASTLLWWATEFGQHSGLTQNLLLGTGVSNLFSAFFRHFNHVILFPGFPIETCMVLK